MKKTGIISWFVVTILVLIVLLPVLSILSVAGNQAEIDKQEIALSIKESLFTTGIVVLITFPLSLLCAASLYFSSIKFKPLFSTFCILPMFIPPISIGFGLLTLLGKNGLFFLLFGLRISLLGRTGVILGHVLYTFPIAFLLFSNSFHQLDINIYENSLLLKIPFYKYLLRIVFPKIKRTLIAVIFQISIMSFSEYGICLIIGGRTKTLALLVYRFVIGRLDFKAGLVLGGIVLLPIIILSAFNIFSHPIKQGIIYRQFASTHAKTINVAAYIFLALVSLVSIFLIVAQLFMGLTSNYPISTSLSFTHMKQALSEPYVRYLFNSLFVSVLTSSFGCILASVVAYYAHKGSCRIVRRILFFVATLPYAIPGLLFGIGYLILFRGSKLSGTYIIIMLANIAHFFASPFLLSYHTINHFSPECEDILLLYSIPTWRKVKDVLIPYLKNTLCDMFFYFFTNSMITISAVAFLSTPQTMPYALALNSFEGEIEYLGKTASISVVILIINILLFLLVDRFKKFPAHISYVSSAPLEE